MIVALILAAGAGSRFTADRHKLLSLLRGMRVIDHAVAAVRTAIAEGAPIDRIIVVSGAVALAPLPTDVLVVDNPNWAEGQATSLTVGIDSAAALGADAVVVGLGDQPFIDPAAWHAVAASQAAIAVATYSGSATRTPALIRRVAWEHLPKTGDFGARHLISSRPELVEPVPCLGTPADIDTIEDLESWNP
ncbi:MAG: NTP transferase domain-containing protein [Actinomycetota bacterium]